jgi:hypothetical protein
VCLAGFATLNALAQDPNGSIEGRVDPNGTDLSKARVCAEPYKIERIALCHTLGQPSWLGKLYYFKFPSLLFGRWYIRVHIGNGIFAEGEATVVTQENRKAEPEPLKVKQARLSDPGLWPVRSAENRWFPTGVQLIRASWLTGGRIQPEDGAPSSDAAPNGGSVWDSGSVNAGVLDAARRIVFNADVVEVLPLAGIRTFDSFALLGPGVFPPPQTNSSPGPGISPGVGSAGQFSVNGLRSRDNNFTVDGSDNNEEDVGVRRQGFVALIPQPIESIDEFQVVTLLGDARFGRNIGGVVNIQSKSGGEEYHGTAYGFLTDRRLNARNFFDSSGLGGPPRLPLVDGGRPVELDGQSLLVDNPKAETAPYTRLQSGFALGGPVVPRRSNPRTFFFASFERLGVHARQDSDFAVPTVSQRGVFDSGDTGLWKLGSERIATTPDSLPGNAMFSLYPFPNNPSGPYGPNTYTTALPADASAVLGSIRFDRDFSQGNSTTASSRSQICWKCTRVTGRYNISDESSILPVTGGGIFSSLEPRLRTQNVASYISTNFTPNTAQIIRLSYGRTSSHFDPVSSDGLLPSLALPNTPLLLNAPLLLNVTTPPASGARYVSASSTTGSAILQSLGYGAITDSEQITGPLGQVNIAGFSPVGVDVNNFPQTRANNTFQWADNVTHVHGRQTFTGGFDIRRTQINSDLNRNARPLAVFGGLLNPGGRLPLVNSATCSPADASCVLSQEVFTGATLAAAGVPTGFFQTLSAQPDSSLGIRFTQFNFFFQDEIHIRPDLVLTAGVRYELNTVPHTVGKKLEDAFDRNALLSDAEATQAQCPGRCADLTSFFQDIPDYSVGFGSDPWAIHPRLGFAWNPEGTGGFAIRGGFGTYSSPSPGIVLDQSRSAFPDYIPLNVVNFSIPSNGGSLLFNLANQQVRTLNPYLDVISPNTLNQLVPGTNPVQLLAIDLYSLRGSLSPTFPALDLVLPAANLRNPRSYQFGLTVEKELPWKTMGSVAYVGTIGVSLFQMSTPDLGLDRSLVQFANDVPLIVAQPAQGQNVVFPFFEGIMRPPQTSRVSNSFTVVPTLFESSASSTYNSLQMELRRQYFQNLEFGTAFTYSHAIDNASDFFDTAGSFALPQDSVHPSERGSSGFDSRLRSVTHFVWDLPIRPTKMKWLGSWKLVGVFTSQSGQPYTVNTSIDVNRDGNLTDRIQNVGLLLIGGGGDPRVQLRLAPGVSPLGLLAPDGQDGAEGRNTFRAPGIISLDAALVKDFTFRERHAITFRMEGFNVLNRVNFGIPVRVLEAPGFGTSFNTTVPARTLQLALKYTF